MQIDKNQYQTRAQHFRKCSIEIYIPYCRTIDCTVKLSNSITQSKSNRQQAPVPAERIGRVEQLRQSSLNSRLDVLRWLFNTRNAVLHRRQSTADNIPYALSLAVERILEARLLKAPLQ